VVSDDTYSNDAGHNEEGGVRNVTVVVHEEVERVVPTSLRVNPTYIQVSRTIDIS
jgi:hypothetical protein